MITNDKYCVYAHINKINGKIYIGQTCQSLNRRWRDGEGYKSCTLFYRAIEKYGWDNFDHEIIASNLTLQEANHFEELLIQKLNSTHPQMGYNLQFGGTNKTPSEEARKRISENHSNNKGQNNPFYGKHHTQEAKQKISQVHKGKRIGINHPRARKIIQYNKQGDIIKIWDCIKQVENTLKIHSSHITQCCQKQRKSTGGFIWRYADDINSNDVAL